MNCHPPFVILIVSNLGSHLSSCTFPSDVCECRLLGYLDFVKEGDDIYQSDRLSTIIGNIYPTCMPPRDSLIRYRNILHLTECDKILPCSCTRKLFECGFYRIRLSEHGVHLTRCSHSIDRPHLEKCECDIVFKQLQQNSLNKSMTTLSMD